MLGVDRLDMIKGIPQKILAFEKFLEENPEWHNKVVLVQIAVPTRTDVPECMYHLSSHSNFTEVSTKFIFTIILLSVSSACCI